MNLHGHYLADPRGADNFNRWCNDRIWELLQRPAFWNVYDTNQGGGVTFGGENSVMYQLMIDAINAVAHPQRPGLRHRIVLLDGTIVHEWPTMPQSEAT